MMDLISIDHQPEYFRIPALEFPNLSRFILTLRGVNFSMTVVNNRHSLFLLFMHQVQYNEIISLCTIKCCELTHAKLTQKVTSFSRHPNKTGTDDTQHVTLKIFQPRHGLWKIKRHKREGNRKEHQETR